MKKILSLLSLTVLLQVTNLYAQPAPEKNPEGYTAGQIQLPDNSTLSGPIKDNIRKKGEVTILQEGKKTKYKAGDITNVQIGSSNFITYNYTFYEIIWQGQNIMLLRKASEASGVQYNGVEPVVISSSEGDIDDYFVKKTADASYYLLTAKTAKEVLGKLCSSCSTILDAAKLDIDAVRKTIEACDKCK